jgi:hypothetical protein
MAFGVARQQAGEAWWHLERRAERNRILRAAAAQLVGARALDLELRRYLAAGWPIDRRRGAVAAEHAGTMRELLFQVCKSAAGRPPRLRQLYEILA